MKNETCLHWSHTSVEQNTSRSRSYAAIQSSTLWLRLVLCEGDQKTPPAGRGPHALSASTPLRRKKEKKEPTKKNENQK